MGLDKPKGRAVKGGGSVAFAGWCQCGERFDSGAAWERHSDRTGHRRFACLPDPGTVGIIAICEEPADRVAEECPLHSEPWPCSICAESTSGERFDPPSSEAS